MRTYRKYCQSGFIYTKPNILVFIAYWSFNFKIFFEEYNGTYKRLIHVFAVGKCWSSTGRIVTDGWGWKPASDAGKAGLPVQK
jgi:hypothetical protein